jgi:two-component system response regulator GlrR
MNVIEHCIALGDGPLITRALVDRALDAASSEPGGSALPPLVEARDQFERDYIAQLLKLTAGNVANAARMAGRNRTEFYRLMQKHGFKGDMFKE